MTLISVQERCNEWMNEESELIGLYVECIDMQQRCMHIHVSLRTIFVTDTGGTSHLNKRIFDVGTTLHCK